MSQKKIFLFLVVISTLSLLLHHTGHVSWPIKAFLLGCAAPGIKPKQTSLAFLKTHKTASSTLQNIIFRFAERHNLTVALPIQTCGTHQFCYPQPFSAHFVHPHTMPPHVIASHMRLDLVELQRLMPNDTVYITILREPASMFESLFSYYNQYSLSFKRVPNGSLEAFLDNPWHYYQPQEKNSMYARNTLTFDLGGDKDRPPDDSEYIKAFIATVESNFSLVMIAEHFDESLVLLRHLLSWDLEDVLYIKLNMRTPSSRQHMEPSLVSKAREWNALDFHLYRHFNESLWRQLAQLGLRCVKRELGLLQQAQERLVRGCFGGHMPRPCSAANIRHRELRPWKPIGRVDVMGYDLPANMSHMGSASQELCLKMLLPEGQYSSLLLRLQSIRYRRNNPLRIAKAAKHQPSEDSPNGRLQSRKQHLS